MDTILSFIDAIGSTVIATAGRIVTAAQAWVSTQPPWLPATVALAVASGAALLFTLARRTRRRDHGRTESRDASSVRAGRSAALNLKSPAPRRPAWTPAAGAQQAREMVTHGVPAIDIARRTGLSRDAVSLLLSMAGQEDRQGRPRTAGLSSRGPDSGTHRGAGLHA